MKTERTTSPRPRPPADKLGFGLYFTDHMLRMDWEKGRWQEPRIQPYGPLSLDPTACVLHYGQTIFEGMKAYRGPEGDLAPRLFRPQKHAERWNASAERICMPTMEATLFIDCVKGLVKMDADWMPQGPETSLYVRPLMIATEAFLG